MDISGGVRWISGFLFLRTFLVCCRLYPLHSNFLAYWSTIAPLMGAPSSSIVFFSLLIMSLEIICILEFSFSALFSLTVLFEITIVFSVNKSIQFEFDDNELLVPQPSNRSPLHLSSLHYISRSFTSSLL